MSSKAGSQASRRAAGPAIEHFAVAELGGEGPYRVFDSRQRAEAFVDSKTGPSQATLFPSAFELRGRPAAVWIVCIGDRGCTTDVLGMHASEAEAEADVAAVAATEEIQSTGFDVWCARVAVNDLTDRG